jgi:hypothetical protein
MENYILIVRGIDPAAVLSTKEEVEGFMNQWLEWRKLLDEQGRLVLSIQLDYAAKGVKGKDKSIFNDPVKTDGKMIGGYLIIKTESLDEAVEISKGCPALELDGSVEVRAFKNVFHAGAFVPAN